MVGSAKRDSGYVRANTGGERGIRTLEGLLTLTPLAGARLRPLGHLSADGIYQLNQCINGWRRPPARTGRHDTGEANAGKGARGRRRSSLDGRLLGRATGHHTERRLWSAPLDSALATNSGSCSSCLMRSKISSRCTATVRGALIPIRTWFPFTPNTVTVTSLPIITVSPTRRVRINISVLQVTLEFIAWP